ncbi:anti-sigma factor [Pseudonocardia abyssalis]|uniref:Anti-sigma factor n=1 Tax=Pseudonocardia abyssalis TaxID=2792008 RepID=A0ABS6UMU2_9PSEU|nr:anti-sigma factor [Pseudonocardia abyssalis]MBW0115626.1 anti-sigma factor [Pseudonocardia abyssalis]MBW0133560.1 anti-sigma factor [Pseudonocardia abyssalis]
MWHPEPDQLSLAALTSTPRDARVDRHLETCPPCHAHVDLLRRSIDLAVSGRAGPDDEPPPGRVWTAITGELGPRRRRWVAPVAAAVAALLVGLGAGWLLGGASPAEQPLGTLAAVGGSGATGSVALSGRGGVREIVIRVEGVIAPPDTDYLEAWLVDDAGTGMLSLGALARDGGGYEGMFTVPADLPMARFPTLEVSAERFDGVPAHSGDGLLRGAVG